MRRKPARKLLRSIATLRSTLRRSRRRLCRLLADRPAASHNTARPAQDRTYGPVFDHLDAELAIVERDLAAAEDNLAANRVRPIQLRGRRDLDAASLADLHTPIRRLLGGQPIKGADILPVAPDSPEALAYHMTLAVDVLRALEREPPWPVGGVRVDAGVLADELEDGQRTLEASLRALEHSEWDVMHARSEANEAFARAGEVTSWVAWMLEGLSGLAGEEGLAGRIRNRCG